MHRLAPAGALIALTSILVVALSANAAGPGGWTQITHAHSGARANLGVARGKDGTLHVLWAGPARAPFKVLFDTAVSFAGAVARPRPVVSGWYSVLPPAAVAAPDGSIHVVFSGQKVNSNTDPFSGLNEVVGPGTWKLGPHAFGIAQLTVPSSSDVRSAFLKNG